MKKVFRIGVLACASLLFFGACSSDDNNSGQVTEQGVSSDLPSSARSFVSEYFQGYTYSKVQKLSSLNTNGASYVAIMKEGVEIEFDSNGQWVNIDGKNNALPQDVANLLPVSAITYVEQNQKNVTKSTNSSLATIIKLLRLKYGYQVDLEGDKAYIFDKIGEFLSNDKTSIHQGNVNINDLPQPARNFVSANFASETYLYVAKLNIPVYGTIYNVYLSNGYKIKFDNEGQLKEVDRDDNAIPTSVLNAVLPQNVTFYLTSKYPTIGVESIEKKSDRYEIELLNDLDLEFDMQGNYLGSDNDDNDEEKVDPAALPQNIIDFISSSFPNANGYKEVKKNTIPDDGVMYEVQLNNDIQLEFDASGNWLEVKAKRGVLPQTFINSLPANIVSYLSINQRGVGVEQISLDRKGYEVDLINGIEIEFDLNGNFVKIDR